MISGVLLTSRLADPSIRFWGVRGSLATPVAANLTYGGNTPCLQVNVGSEVFLFDAGTGIARFSEHLQAENSTDIYAFHLFFSHFHWDHIQGLPFFSPLYQPGTQLSLYSTAPIQFMTDVLRRLMG